MGSEKTPSGILLVDDEPLVRNTLRSILLHLGDFKVWEAEDGLCALETLENEAVDIVITDINMPRLEGLELLRRIKESNPLIPVAIITGFPSLDVAVKAMKQGASDFIAKPFRVEEIELIVQKLLNERKLLLENAQLNRELEQKKEIERLNHKLNQKIRDLTVLYKIGEVLNESTLDRNNLFKQVAELAMEVTNARKTSLMLMDPERKRLVIKASCGIPTDIAQKISLRLGEGIAGQVAKEGIPLLVKDIHRSRKYIDASVGHYKTNSFISVPLLIKGEVLGVINAADKEDGISFSKNEMNLLSAVAQRAALCLENLALYESVYNNLVDTLRSLVSTIEAKDSYTKLHSARVTQWSVEIATALNIDKEDIDIIQFAGYLHDIGKIGIPDSILMKPGRLTVEEYDLIKTHPAIGEKIVKPLDLLPKERDLIRHHHERWDGKGYPDGLAGEDIPLLARIMAIADSFDAMTSDRVYRKAKGVKDALYELNQCAGSQFDPFVVETFLALQEQNKDEMLLGNRMISVPTVMP
ncbi:MAG: response regulator [Deltaproteobacteria bacterium]|nr:response regulator [Deltaproteobacteria bacterium]